MNSIKKIAFVGCALFATSTLLVSFANDNGGDKKKKYQIIHQSNGEMITYDTVIPMSSSFTPEQFLAEKGISNEDVNIIEIPSVTEMETGDRVMKTIVHEIEIEEDNNGSKEEVEINVEIDENGEMTTKKTVNGVEVEMTEDELKRIKTNHGDHGEVVQMRFEADENSKVDENVEISVEIDEDGKKTIKKIVNGEEVEMTEEEMDNLQIFEMMDGDDVNIFISDEISEELDDVLKELEIEIENMSGDADKEVKIIQKRIEMRSDDEGNDFTWESEDGEQRMMVMSSDDTKDFTMVLVTENYDEANASKTKMIFEESNEEMDVYPNPSNGTFKIRYESDENAKTTITVVDANGKKVFEEKLGKFSGKYEKEINLKEFGSGMYTITIQNGNNEEIQKVMIK